MCQGTSRDLHDAPAKPSGGGSSGDLGHLTNGQQQHSAGGGGADSPGGGSTSSGAPSAGYHPSRELLEDILSRPGPYPMVNIHNTANFRTGGKTSDFNYAAHPFCPPSPLL